MYTRVIRPMLDELQGRDFSELEDILSLSAGGLRDRLEGVTAFSMPELICVCRWGGLSLAGVFGAIEDVLDPARKLGVTEP